MTDHSEVTDPKLQARVRARYHRETDRLQSMGFVHLAFCYEALGPYSAIWHFPLMFLMLPKKEVITFSSPFRLGVANVALVHSAPPSIAFCMGMGVKFYSSFSDGSILISASFQSHAIPRPDSRMIKNAANRTLESSWLSHAERVKELEGEGKSILPLKSFADYVGISTLEEDESQYLV